MRMDSKVTFLLLGLVVSEAGFALHQLHQVREDVSALRAQVDIILKKEDLFGSLYPSNSNGRGGPVTRLVVQPKHRSARPDPTDPSPRGELFGADYFWPGRTSERWDGTSRDWRWDFSESRAPSSPSVAQGLDPLEAFEVD